jgi:hypothetical protein
VLGNGGDRSLDGTLSGKTDGVVQPGVGDMVQERLRRAAGVGAHQHLATLGLGQLLQRGVQHTDVVSAVKR